MTRTHYLLLKYYWYRDFILKLVSYFIGPFWFIFLFDIIDMSLKQIMTPSLAARRRTLLRVRKECWENFLPYLCGTYSRSPVRPVMSCYCKRKIEVSLLNTDIKQKLYFSLTFYLFPRLGFWAPTNCRLFHIEPSTICISCRYCKYWRANRTAIWLNRTYFLFTLCVISLLLEWYQIIR